MHQSDAYKYIQNTLRMKQWNYRDILKFIAIIIYSRIATCLSHMSRVLGDAPQGENWNGWMVTPNTRRAVIYSRYKRHRQIRINATLNLSTFYAYLKFLTDFVMWLQAPVLYEVWCRKNAETDDEMCCARTQLTQLTICSEAGLVMARTAAVCILVGRR